MGGDFGVRTLLSTRAPLLARSPNIKSGVRGASRAVGFGYIVHVRPPIRCHRRRRMCNRYRHGPHRHGRRGRCCRGPAGKSAGRQLSRSAGRRSARQQVGGWQVGRPPGRQGRRSATWVKKWRSASYASTRGVLAVSEACRGEEAMARATVATESDSPMRLNSTRRATKSKE